MPTDQIGDCVLISRSVQTTPSSTKPPIHYNNTKTAESQQPTSAADISHLADAAWQPKSADWIANRTPIPDPVRATHPDSRPSTRPIPSKPQNTNTPPAHSTAAAIPTTTTQPKSASQIANHWPIPDPVRTTPPANRPPTAIITKTAEYQHSSNAQKTINRSTGHQTAHASGPNRKSHTNLGSSPLAQPRRPERRLSNHSITCHSRLQKERRTPTVMRLGNPGRWGFSWS